VIDANFRGIEQEPATDPRHDRAPGRDKWLASRGKTCESRQRYICTLIVPSEPNDVKHSVS
jgi:hypothetical protein